MNFVTSWFRRQFSDPQVVILTLILVTIAAAVLLVGDMLAPVIAAVVIGYLLDEIVVRLERLRIPRSLAVLIVILLFMAVLLLLVFGLLPLLITQMTDLFQQVPGMISEAQKLIMQLPSRYPGVISEQQVTELVSGLGAELVRLSQPLLSVSVSSVLTLFTIGVYLILVPLLVFFMIRDKQLIWDWLTGFLPRERQLSKRVWIEVNTQIGNYIRGKVWEIIIVGGASFIVFAAIGLDYSLLLAAITGVSVLVPYVGAVVAAIPVAVAAFFQWGVSSEVLYALLAYGILQFVDGFFLAPMLLSGAVNMHPIAIIVAILLFGGLWGFWGVFFAVPLATVFHAVLRAWPRTQDDIADDTDSVKQLEQQDSA